MNDTLSIKSLALSTIGATQLPGTAHDYARVASTDYKVHLRQSNHIGSLSPSVLRIQHQPRTTKSDMQRTVIALEQIRNRVDALGNTIDEEFNAVKFQSDIGRTTTLAEFRADVAELIGALTASDGALIDQLFYAQT